MPIVVQHGQTGDFSTLLRLQEAQNQQNQASNAYIMNAFNQNAYEKRAETAAKQKAEALAAQGLAPDKSALERLVGMDKQATREVNAEYETNRESRSKEAMKWDDELSRRLKARQDAEQQKAFQNKIILSNFQAQQQAQLQEQQARQQEEMQFQKARDKGDITLIPSVQKTMSDLQNRLASINNSPRLTPRQKQEQSAIIKQQLGGIQNNRDNYTQNQNQPMNIENLEKKGYLKKREDGSFEAYNPQNGKFEIVDDPVKKRNAELAIEMAKLKQKEKEIEFNSGLKFSKQEVNMQKRISSLEQQIKYANSDLARATSGNSYTDENKAFVNQRQKDLAALSAELIKAYSEYSNSRNAVDQPTQQGQRGQPMQQAQAQAQAQAEQQAQIPPEMQAAINWIKTHPSEQDRPKREAAIQKLKALGITGI